MQPVTRASIESAKQQQLREREAVYQATGIRISDEGRIVKGQS